MMQQEKRTLLEKHIVKLSAKIHLHEILDSMMAKSMFNESVVDHINSYGTEIERRQELVRAVQRRGDVAYDAFYDSLTECGHVELAALLEPLVYNHSLSSHVSRSQNHHQGGGGGGVKTRMSTRRAMSPSYTSPITRRTSIVASAEQNAVEAFRNMMERVRSPTRTIRTLCPTDRPNFTSPSRFGIPRQIADSIIHEQIGLRRSRTRSRYRGSSMSENCLDYVFNEDSMNYVDSPQVQRTFDKETMYPNFSKPHGLCLIINNEHFSTMPTRNGTKMDKENLSNLFRCMGYSIVGRDNLTAREIMTTIHEFTKNQMHRQCDSAILIILSHGEENQIIGVDGQSVNTHEMCDLLSASKAPLLANKPKIVFVQACRGERRDHGFSYYDEPDGIPALARRGGFDKGDGPISLSFMQCVRPQSQQSYRKKPDQADILISYATTAQYVSWRNSVRGSWFVQALCEVFAEKAQKMDIVEMLTLVNKKVANGFQTSQGTLTMKQMPELTSRLVKKFYLWPSRDTAV